MCITVSDFSSVFELAVGVNLALSILNEVGNPVIARFNAAIGLKREVLLAVVKDADEKKLVASQINIIASHFADDIEEFGKLKN